MSGVDSSLRRNQGGMNVESFLVSTKIPLESSATSTVENRIEEGDIGECVDVCVLESGTKPDETSHEESIKKATCIVLLSTILIFGPFSICALDRFRIVCN